MDGETLVVRLDDGLEVGVDVGPAELEGLQGAEQRADGERGHGDADVPADEALLVPREFERLDVDDRLLEGVVAGTAGIVVDDRHCPSSPSVPAAGCSSLGWVPVSAAAASSGNSATTLTVPYIWACPVPQYSWQM